MIEHVYKHLTATLQLLFFIDVKKRTMIRFVVKKKVLFHTKPTPLKATDSYFFLSL